MSDDAGADVATAARAIVDDHPLRPALAERLRQDAGERVEAAARRRRNHDPHRPRWVVLGPPLSKTEDYEHCARP